MELTLLRLKAFIKPKQELCDTVESIVSTVIDQSCFPDSARLSSITATFKKIDRMDKLNNRLISVLPCLSKILEKVIDIVVNV